MGNEQEEVILSNDMIASLGYRICSWSENKYPDRVGGPLGSGAFGRRRHGWRGAIAPISTSCSRATG
jgi:hypothetical protein